MKEKYLNIISFNIPYPPNYGGVIDVFYKLKSLSDNGVKIILHTFDYGRGHTPELEKYCDEIHYYKRKTGIFSQFSTLPYIVFSRRNKELLSNLQKNDYPILFEGLHTCYYLSDSSLKNRLKIVRIHNIEHYYYRGLAKNAGTFPLRMYFNLEANKLEKFENQLHFSNYLLPLSTTEQSYFERKYGQEKTIYVPLFSPNNGPVSISEEVKPYVLFHGDLSNWENINAANFLIQNVASKGSDIEWIFAGLNPPRSLLELSKNYNNVSIYGSVPENELQQMIREAAVNILYTNQVSGVKLKLLNALHNGHYCLANKEMVDGSGLEDLCIIISKQPDEIIAEIRKCFQGKISENDWKKRQEAFDEIYNNKKNALIIKKILSFPQL